MSIERRRRRRARLADRFKYGAAITLFRETFIHDEWIIETVRARVHGSKPPPAFTPHVPWDSLDKRRLLEVIGGLSR